MNDTASLSSSALDNIHHITLTVADIDRSIRWYQGSFRCSVIYQDKAQAVLQFGNIRLALALPSLEPAHIAFERADASTLGSLRERSDGSFSTFLADPTGNPIEILAVEQGSASS